MCKKAYPEKGEKCCSHQKAVGKRGLCQRCQRKLEKARGRHYRAQEEALRARAKQEEAAVKAAAIQAQKEKKGGEETWDIGDGASTVVVGSFEEFLALIDSGAADGNSGRNIVYRAAR